MFEPQERNEPFAAEREIQARDEGAVAVDPEPEAVRDVEIAELEVSAAPVATCAGIDEQGAVERPPRFPAVLGAEKHGCCDPESGTRGSREAPCAPPSVG